MRKIQNYLSCLLILLMVSACDEPSISSLSVTSSLDGNLQSLASGDTFELTIEAKDDDGIDFVKIESSLLDLELLYENIGQKEWKLTKEIEIKAGTASGEAEIRVRMKDDAGEEKVSSSFLSIQ
ncbi:MAG: hypothetical protein R8P61_00960 [Bacteroidia bacterium]|nr:hypothetical protein [Bacteroidia bacterium]